MTTEEEHGLDTEALDHLLALVQDGVVSRRQLTALGARPHDTRRLLRRRLTVVHPGVYVDHTGPLTWEQRCWVAVHAHWPAALTRESALPRPDHDLPVQVAVDARRTVSPVRGARAHRTADLAGRADWRRSPPRIRLEHAAIHVAGAAAAAGDLGAAFTTFADAVHTRETTAADIAAVLRTRRGAPRRTDLRDLLTDLEAGACSVLEREWLRVERVHDLPDDGRQAPDLVRGARIRRDVDHRAWRVVVELDGQAHHSSARDRERDAVRDLESCIDGDLLTVRLTWSMVTRDGCRSARQVATLLTRRGWPGTFRPCPSCPA